jgi:DNA invertase Pin-like site-specific DNA recombinase
MPGAKRKKMKRAYSYIRFSRAHQIEGDSLRRQTQETEKYCKRHNLTLDDSLKLKDFGVSAYEGKNVKHGALGRFIAACESGTVPRGSALILESLDRLSRQTPRKTVRLLTELMDDYGIEIHLTQIGKIFRPESEDGVDLIFAVALAMRANDESRTKSKRLKEAFAEKRRKAAEGSDFVSKALPWWLSWDKDGKIKCDDDRKKVLLQVFHDVAGGKSPLQVARDLNKEGTPTWRFKGRLKDKDDKPYGPPIPSKYWSDNRIRMTILSDAPMGTIQSTRKTKVAGRKWQIEKYYPQIVDPDLVAKARATIKENRKKQSGRLPTENTIPNILKSILRYRKHWCRFSVHRTRIGTWNGYYEAVDNNRRMPWCIAASQLEPILITSIADLKLENLKPPSTGNPQTAILRAEAKTLENTLANITLAVEAGSTTMIPRLVEVEKALAETKEQLATAEASDGTKIAPQTITHLKGYTIEDLKCPERRTEIAVALRQLISVIQIGSDLHDFAPAPGEPILTLEDNDTIWEDELADPTGSRGKKPLAMHVKFHGGGEMAIQRGTVDSPNFILVTRIFRNGDEVVAPDSAN